MYCMQRKNMVHLFKESNRVFLATCGMFQCSSSLCFRVDDLMRISFNAQNEDPKCCMMYRYVFLRETDLTKSD